MDVIRGGANRPVQQRALRGDGWTKEKRTEFLANLLLTCNVQGSCRAIGLTKRGAYHLRHRNAEFAQLWDEVLEQGYVQLECELLARALGDQHDPANPDGFAAIAAAAETVEAAATAASPEKPAPFDPELAMRLLGRRDRCRRGERTRPARLRPEQAKDTNTELEKRLAAVERRIGKRT